MARMALMHFLMGLYPVDVNISLKNWLLSYTTPTSLHLLVAGCLLSIARFCQLSRCISQMFCLIYTRHCPGSISRHFCAWMQMMQWSKLGICPLQIWSLVAGKMAWWLVKFSKLPHIMVGPYTPCLGWVPSHKRTLQFAVESHWLLGCGTLTIHTSHLIFGNWLLIQFTHSSWQHRML